MASELATVRKIFLLRLTPDGDRKLVSKYPARAMTTGRFVLASKSARQRRSSNEANIVEICELLNDFDSAGTKLMLV